MKKFLTLFLLIGVVCPVWAATSKTNPLSIDDKHVFFQVGTMASLAQGIFDGDYSYGNLMKHGNFGVGTFLDLNGEMIAMNGDFYQIKATGEGKQVEANQIFPFAEVTQFKPTLFEKLGAFTSYHNLENKILKILPNKNIPYAIRIEGEFDSVKLRSLRKQDQPYSPLVDATKNAGEFTFHNIKGYLVGFWLPIYWSGIAVPGFHFHFLTADKSTGGHVLELDIHRGQLSIEPLHHIEIYLPNTESFAKANLSASRGQELGDNN